jgi:hypothetical protein
MAGSQIEKAGAHGSESEEVLVKQLSPGELLHFASAPYCIINAGDAVTPSSFPAAILILLRLFQPISIRMGVLELGAIDWGMATRHLAKLALDGLQMRPDNFGRPPAGFYLFADGVPIAFHSGEVDLNKDGGQLGLALATLILGKAMESKGVASAAPHVATWNAGERVANHFKMAIEAHRQRRR